MIYIRADMNDIIATGHIMRCLAIADAVRELGDDVTFITADSKAASLLSEKSYHNIILDSAWNDLEGELPGLCATLKKLDAKCLLIDSYYVTEKYLKEISAIVQTIYLDDLNSFFYPVHGLICYANYWKKFNYHERYTAAELLLGTEYVPLRKEFRSCTPKTIKKEIENVLIVSGGSDNENTIRRLLCSFERIDIKQICVVCGIYYKDFDGLINDFGCNKKIDIRRNAANIKDYFESADLVFSAGGSTLYELCACGTPTVSFALADNQINNVRQFADDGLIPYIGDVREIDISQNVPEIVKKMTYEMRCKISGKMQKVVDGKGAMRIAEFLLK
ncbi:MAG: UDP-2,4-diacetamido-2,4,6-trideoxy-beta-L-altropyranose hydrolase [Clostridiaceae bacterium]|nr:UDP-2,4-diacetamido-2,4,6-trideoxy-beta-L-altropyranose hydrolase [Clostridiaceae bacterium]